MKEPREAGWTWEQASAADKRYRRGRTVVSTDPRPHGPIVKWIAYSNLKKEQKRFENGSDRALMDAIACCAWAAIPLPDWAAIAFWERHLKVVNFEAKTWDQAFGQPHKKNVNVKARRKTDELSVLVWRAVQSSNAAIDEQLFAEVGKALKPPISGATARNYYYGINKLMEKLQGVKRAQLLAANLTPGTRQVLKAIEGKELAPPLSKRRRTSKSPPKVL